MKPYRVRRDPTLGHQYGENPNYPAYDLVQPPTPEELLAEAHHAHILAMGPADQDRELRQLIAEAEWELGLYDVDLAPEVRPWSRREVASTDM